MFRKLLRLRRTRRFRLARERMDQMSQPMVNAMFRTIVGRWRYERRRDIREVRHFNTLPDCDESCRDCRD